MTKELEPLAPTETKEMFLADRRGQVAERTVQADDDRLRFFIRQAEGYLDYLSFPLWIRRGSSGICNRRSRPIAERIPIRKVKSIPDIGGAIIGP